jgi:hypothetical protein
MQSRRMLEAGGANSCRFHRNVRATNQTAEVGTRGPQGSAAAGRDARAAVTFAATTATGLGWSAGDSVPCFAATRCHHLQDGCEVFPWQNGKDKQTDTDETRKGAKIMSQ